ncbi:adenine specific DNA methyltransferase [Helicobacter cetorum MIT 00-7128]|uniref:Adenine specific DNA methyltransferase n=2 Tax=Helicobacter cetorum TaxID=138563 RepID=I0EMF2_HELC0|nr:SNF2-related protein [Helicobacter cetorum]AFI04121.1 adenine specific DNA methyltransferase [Helicobacter cetorum MIT 00-7128]
MAYKPSKKKLNELREQPNLFSILDDGDVINTSPYKQENTDITLEPTTTLPSKEQEPLNYQVKFKSNTLSMINRNPIEWAEYLSSEQRQYDDNSTEEVSFFANGEVKDSSRYYEINNEGFKKRVTKNYKLIDTKTNQALNDKETERLTYTNSLEDLKEQGLEVELTHHYETHKKVLENGNEITKEYDHIADVYTEVERTSNYELVKEIVPPMSSKEYFKLCNKLPFETQGNDNAMSNDILEPSTSNTILSTQNPNTPIKTLEFELAQKVQDFVRNIEDNARTTRYGAWLDKHEPYPSFSWKIYKLLRNSIAKENNLSIENATRIEEFISHNNHILGWTKEEQETMQDDLDYSLMKDFYGKTPRKLLSLEEVSKAKMELQEYYQKVYVKGRSQWDKWNIKEREIKPFEDILRDIDNFEKAYKERYNDFISLNETIIQAKESKNNDLENSRTKEQTLLETYFIDLKALQDLKERYATENNPTFSDYKNLKAEQNAMLFARSDEEIEAKYPLGFKFSQMKEKYQSELIKLSINSTLYNNAPKDNGAEILQLLDNAFMLYVSNKDLSLGHLESVLAQLEIQKTLEDLREFDLYQAFENANENTLGLNNDTLNNAELNHTNHSIENTLKEQNNPNPTLSTQSLFSDLEIFGISKQELQKAKETYQQNKPYKYSTEGYNVMPFVYQTSLYQTTQDFNYIRLSDLEDRMVGIIKKTLEHYIKNENMSLEHVESMLNKVANALEKIDKNTKDLRFLELNHAQKEPYVIANTEFEVFDNVLDLFPNETINQFVDNEINPNDTLMDIAYSVQEKVRENYQLSQELNRPIENTTPQENTLSTPPNPMINEIKTAIEELDQVEKEFYSVDYKTQADNLYKEMFENPENLSEFKLTQMAKGIQNAKNNLLEQEKKRQEISKLKEHYNQSLENLQTRDSLSILNQPNGAMKEFLAKELGTPSTSNEFVKNLEDLLWDIDICKRNFNSLLIDRNTLRDESSLRPLKAKASALNNPFLNHFYEINFDVMGADNLNPATPKDIITIPTMQEYYEFKNAVRLNGAYHQSLETKLDKLETLMREFCAKFHKEFGIDLIDLNNPLNQPFKASKTPLEQLQDLINNEPNKETLKEEFNQKLNAIVSNNAIINTFKRNIDITEMVLNDFKKDMSMDFENLYYNNKEFNALITQSLSVIVGDLISENSLMDNKTIDNTIEPNQSINNSITENNDNNNPSLSNASLELEQQNLGEQNANNNDARIERDGAEVHRDLHTIRIPRETQERTQKEMGERIQEKIPKQNIQNKDLALHNEPRETTSERILQSSDPRLVSRGTPPRQHVENDHLARNGHRTSTGGNETERREETSGHQNDVGGREERDLSQDERRTPPLSQQEPSQSGQRNDMVSHGADDREEGLGLLRLSNPREMGALFPTNDEINGERSSREHINSDRESNQDGTRSPRQHAISNQESARDDRYGATQRGSNQSVSLSTNKQNYREPSVERGLESARESRDKKTRLQANLDNLQGLLHSIKNNTIASEPNFRERLIQAISTNPTLSAHHLGKQLLENPTTKTFIDEWGEKISSKEVIGLFENLLEGTLKDLESSQKTQEQEPILEKQNEQEISNLRLYTMSEKLELLIQSIEKKELVDSLKIDTDNKLEELFYIMQESLSDLDGLESARYTRIVAKVQDLPFYLKKQDFKDIEFSDNEKMLLQEVIQMQKEHEQRLIYDKTISTLDKKEALKTPFIFSPLENPLYLDIKEKLDSGSYYYGIISEFYDILLKAEIKQKVYENIKKKDTIILTENSISKEIANLRKNTDRYDNLVIGPRTTENTLKDVKRLFNEELDLSSYVNLSEAIFSANAEVLSSKTNAQELQTIEPIAENSNQEISNFIQEPNAQELSQTSRLQTTPLFESLLKNYNPAPPEIPNFKNENELLNAVFQETITQKNGTEPQATENAKEEQTPQQVQENPKLDFKPNEEILINGKVSRYKANIKAIELLKELQIREKALQDINSDLHYYATKEEKEILAQFSGWGGLESYFKQENPKEHQELKTLLTKQEFEKALLSTRDAYYTPKLVIDSIYAGLEQLGFNNDDNKKEIFEPSCGTGKFLAYAPSDKNYHFVGTELDPISAGISQFLYPNQRIENKALQNYDFYQDYDAFIGNPPYGQHKIYSSNDMELSGASIHNYFLGKAIKELKEDGIGAFVVSSWFLDAKNSKMREHIAKQATFLGAIRLPNSVFKGTGAEVTSDIVFFKKGVNSEINQDFTHSKLYYEDLIKALNNYHAKAIEILQENKLDNLVDRAKLNIINILANYFNLKPQNEQSDFYNIDTSTFGYSEEDYQTIKDFIDKVGENKIDLNEQTLNEYFTNHPQNILGNLSLEKTRYSEEVNGKRIYKYELQVLENKDLDLSNAISKIIKNLPKNVYQYHKKTIKTNALIIDRNDERYKEVSRLIKDLEVGELVKFDNRYYKLEQNNENAIFLAPTKIAGKTQEKRIVEYLKLKVALNDLTNAELNPLSSDLELENKRAKLNAVYEGFVKKFGYLNENKNRKDIRQDLYGAKVLGLEKDFEKEITLKSAKAQNISPRKPSAKKAQIFFERTLNPKKEFSITNAKEALIASLNQKGRLDLHFIRDNFKTQSLEATINELLEQKLIYKDHSDNGDYILANDYLSGNVKKQLKEVKEAIERGVEGLENNLKDLERIIPKDLKATEIMANINSPWIPTKYLEEFLVELASNHYEKQYGYKMNDAQIENIKKDINIYHFQGTFRVVVNGFNNGLDELFGIRDKVHTSYYKVPFSHLLAKVLNNKDLSVKYEKPHPTEPKKTIQVTDEELSNVARSKAEELKEAFQDWIYKDYERRTHLEQIYNDTFNNSVLKTYDGTHLELEGFNSNITLRPHQKNAVFRTIQDRAVCLDHQVGAGKTLCAIASCMEQKRMGLVNKTLIAVPNHLTKQWGDEFYRAYPNANVLVVDSKDITENERELLYNQIANNNYDAVIIAHSHLELLSNPREIVEELREEELNKAEENFRRLEKQYLANKKEFKKPNEKAHKNKLDKINDKYDKILEKQGSHIDISQMGIDNLIVDEAHLFKNLAFETSMEKIAGLGNQQGSNRARDLFIKTRYLHKNNKKMMFLTGTPIANSLSEMYHLQRYLTPEILKERGLDYFDDWAKTYGEVVSDFELDTSAQSYKMVNRFSKFSDVQGLSTMYRAFADIVSNDDILKHNPNFVPKVYGGKPINVVVPRSEEVAQYIGIADENGKYNEGSIIDRMQKCEGKKNKKGEDNILSCTTDARKVALDYRLIDPSAKVEKEFSKSYAMAENIYQNYIETNEVKGTQLGFIGLSTPKVHSQKVSLEEVDYSLGALNEIKEKIQKQFSDRYGSGVNLESNFVNDFIKMHLDNIKQIKAGTFPLEMSLNEYREENSIDDFENELLHDISENTKDYEKYLNLLENTNELENKKAIDETQELLESLSQYDENGKLITPSKKELENELDEKKAKSVDLDEELAKNCKFDVYSDVLRHLVKMGIPQNEIAFIHDAKSEEQKQDLFKRVNRGEVRVLLGSPAKMGVGTNVQERLVAMHELDCPWRPDELLQMEGRGIRQGNLLHQADPENFSMKIYRYATEKTYDSRMWQIIETKSKGIEQFRNAHKLGLNELEDFNMGSSNASEMKAEATGNPLIIEEVKLRQIIKSEEAKYKAFNKEYYFNEESLKNNTSKLDFLHKELKDLEVLKNSVIIPTNTEIKLYDLRNETSKDYELIKVKEVEPLKENATMKEELEHKKLKKQNKQVAEQNKIMLDEIREQFITDMVNLFYKEDEEHKVLEYKGFVVSAFKSKYQVEFSLSPKDNLKVAYTPENLVFKNQNVFATSYNFCGEIKFDGFLKRLDNAITKLPEKIKELENSITNTKENIAKYTRLVEQKEEYPRLEYLQALKLDHRTLIDDLAKMGKDREYKPVFNPKSKEVLKNLEAEKKASLGGESKEQEENKLKNKEQEIKKIDNANNEVCLETDNAIEQNKKTIVSAPYNRFAPTNKQSSQESHLTI